jgi:ParB family chromosome partitioning protein
MMNKDFGTDTKKRKKVALGRGLDALIPDVVAEDQSQDYFQCEVERIRRNRYQPRKNFGDEDLQELAESIKAQGVLQPLLVRKRDSGYELVAGERRLRAAIKAGLEKVPVVVKSVSDAEMLEISIVENIQREDLNPIEEAEAYHRLINEFDLTQDQAAARVGKSRSAVANFLRLRNLPQEIKDSIIDGRLSMGHARALLGAESKVQQTQVWRTIFAKDLSVRETENLIKRAKIAKDKPADPPPSAEQIYFADIASELSRHFGTKVEIKKRGKAGRVFIEFYCDDDLDRLLRLLKGGREI